ncbi:MAG: tetratricopeptide repeat protein [Acidobacteriia bacterium]|nr:tetratricopeptide repeat protein [Methyloceanibacter sp.]MBX5470967.1 tetratricopeptide repeat protein [Acetobacteraceae bacterium]MCL6490344.1 tetratricopeptide repeat protein [Terriglobia bacterium]
MTRRRCLLLTIGLAAMQLSRPAFAQRSPAERAAELDRLLAALKAAPDEATAALLEARIRAFWLEGTSPAVRLLMARGIRNLNAKAAADAERDFDDVIALDPNLAEAYFQRGLARWKQGKAAAAIRDMEETLRRQPRHFDAFRVLSEIAEQRHDYMSALKAWQKLLSLDPKTPGGEAKLKELTRRAMGESA